MPLRWKPHYIIDFNDYRKIFITDSDIDIQFNTSTNNLKLEFKDVTKLSAFQKKMTNKAAKSYLFLKTKNIYINNNNLPLVKEKIVNIINDVMCKNFTNFLENE
jgi:hypothetical protein